METKIFDQIASQYDTEDRIQLANRFLGKPLPNLSETENHTLLDFGCGTGLLGIPLTSRYQEVFFVDDSESLLKSMFYAKLDFKKQIHRSSYTYQGSDKVCYRILQDGNSWLFIREMTCAC